MAHHHHHVDPDSGDKRVFWAVAINLGLTATQIIGGMVSGSLALIADAIHNFSDALSLIIAFIARKIARRPSTNTMTFGYGRAEIVAALINYTTLIIIGMYLIVEATMRFLDPQSVDGWWVVVIAAIALIVDTITALLTYRLSKRSMNIRAAFLHNVADALGSFTVILVGTLIILFDWRLIDPMATLFIASYILWQSFIEVSAVIRILMLGSPPDMDTQVVLNAMKRVNGVEDIHHLHLWQMQEHENALDAHLVIGANNWHDGLAIKAAVKGILNNEFKISHTTLELESADQLCAETETIGHSVNAAPI